jgi:hypothetical protein
LVDPWVATGLAIAPITAEHELGDISRDNREGVVSQLTCEPFEARVRHILLVKSPTDSLVFEKVDDCRDILGNGVEGITV